MQWLKSDTPLLKRPVIYLALAAVVGSLLGLLTHKAFFLIPAVVFGWYMLVVVFAPYMLPKRAEHHNKP